MEKRRNQLNEIYTLQTLNGKAPNELVEAAKSARISLMLAMRLVSIRTEYLKYM
jgi:hypothetical protein